MIDSILATNKRASERGFPLLYSDDEPWLNSAGDPTVAFQITVNSSNLFSLLNNPSEASTTTMYKCWFIDEPPDVNKAWSIVINGTARSCQFVKYEMKAGVFVGYFKHAN